MWVARVLLLCVLGLARGQLGTEEGWVVRTAQGAVRGYPSERGDFYAFHGIPYATAPTGRDKFKAPLPPPVWSEVFEATDEEISCAQPFRDYTLGDEFQEDCLIANVFIPNHALETYNLLPVVVYIHGGGFSSGRGNMASYQQLVSEDVIVVSINYRLGVYGFLCLRTEDVPGNAGMKDQVAALRWVQRNIANFGGNPNDVTVAGFSAGSASVELLMLSPMAKGLFTKANSESGAGLAAFAVDPDPLGMAKRFIAEISGEEFDDVMEIEEFYKTLTMEQLTSKIYLEETDSSFGFAPCIEQKTDTQESFLIESPLDILESGEYNKVPYLTGFASEEGLLRMVLFVAWKDKMNTNFADFLPRDLKFADDTEKNNVAEKVKSFYFKDEPVDFATIKDYADYFTDVMFAYPAITSARLHAANSVPVYLYEYSFVNDIPPVLPNPHSDLITGANHCAQSASLHFLQSSTFIPTENDILMTERLSKMWSDFIKFGTPVITTSALLPVAWDPMDENITNYLSIDLTMQRRERLLADRVEFWDTIYSDYRKSPAPLDNASSGSFAQFSNMLGLISIFALMLFS